MTESQDTLARAAAPTAGTIHADLMQAIREGRYMPGAQLPNERQLAEAYGASRQQVRDALLLLQADALIERKVGSGTWLSLDAPGIIERLDAMVDVHAKHEHGFLETIEARLVIEPGVAALAARNATPAQLAALEAALEAVGGQATWIEFKSRLYLFARAYYEASGNPFLLRTFDLILKARADHRFDGRHEAGAVAEIVRRHSHAQLSAILDAIRARNEEQAERVTRDYLIGIAASSGLQ
jgi:DNA-binding FadR family transcriptional regulator